MMRTGNVHGTARRRWWLGCRPLVSSIAALALTGLMLCGRLAFAAPETKPNVLLIVGDDQGYADMSCLGIRKDVHTPNLDRLVSSGIRFSQAYVSAPICNASRIALITGCYQQRQGQYWYGGPGLHDKRYTTIAEVLKTRGYATGYIGKIHHGGHDAPGQRGFPLQHGFDTFYGFTGGTKHYLRHKRKYTFKGDLMHQGPLYDQDHLVDVDGFTTELFSERARAFIRRHREHPFFLQVAFNAVHNWVHQLPPAYLKEQGLKGIPDFDPAREEYWAWRRRVGFPAHPEGRAWYLGQLHFLDLEIGQLIAELEAQALTRKTVVIYLSDNGGSLVTYARNEPLKGGKYTLFEGGIRVPMMISWPGHLPAGRVVPQPVSAMDIFPTVCALTEGPAPPHLDGMDLSPLLRGDELAGDRESLFWDTGSQYAVRHGRWKLLHTKRSPDPRLQIVDTPKGSFLYDVEGDPGESNDLNAAHPDIVRDLQQRYETWRNGLRQDPER